jgi:histidine triad (HIT) family protein
VAVPQEVFEVVARVSTAVKDAYQTVGSTITQNNDIPGQALHHLYVHVVPRFDSDAFQMPDPRVSEVPCEVRLARASLLRRVLAS